MADFNQRDQRVDHQNNAGRDIRFSQQQIHNQQGQSVNSQQNAGRDVNQDYRRYEQHIKHQERIGGNKITVHTTPAASSVLARGIVIVVVLLLLAGGVAVAFPVIKNAIKSIPTLFNQAGSGINSQVTDPQTSLDRELYGTPMKALDQFCASMKSGHFSGTDSAYNEYSDHLQSQISPGDFENTWANPGESVTACQDNIINSSGTSATGTLVMKVQTISQSGVSEDNPTYNVMLVSSDGIWKIDAMTKQQ